MEGMLPDWAKDWDDKKETTFEMMEEVYGDLIQEQKTNVENFIFALNSFGLERIDEIDGFVILDALACEGLQLVEAMGENVPAFAYLKTVNDQLNEAKNNG